MKNSINLLFYGNCQIGALGEILKSSFTDHKSFLNNVHSYYKSNPHIDISIIACCMDDINKHDFLNKVTNADIIITQPIKQNYRDTNYLHTEFILNNAKHDAQIIIIPSLHFDFYYIDLIYKKIRDPSDYHYDYLFKCYVDRKKEEYYLNEYVNNVHLKTKFELEKIANESLIELERRENENIKYNDIRQCTLITASNFIKNTYKKKLLFYSMNHPSKYVLQHIGEKILDSLHIKNNINYEIDPLFNHERAIIYKCIQPVVEFNIDYIKPRMNNHNLEDIREIIHKYYETYNKYNIDQI